MLAILESISPIFLVILLGFLARRLGFLPDIFISSANRLVYFVAIPILVFDEIAKGPFSRSFDPGQIGGTFPAVGLVGAAAMLLASPSATVTYVMAAKMGGKPDLAAAAVTISTVISIVTYTLWIAVMGG